jgi:hypothetical protein
MRRLVGWIGGALGGFTAYRLFRRRPQVAPDGSTGEPDARADELRAKLAESRAEDLPGSEQRDAGEPDEPAAEVAVEEPPEPDPEQESPEERRRRVHEEAHAALDDMKSDGAA